jgi:hypothetical protein
MNNLIATARESGATIPREAHSMTLRPESLLRAVLGTSVLAILVAILAGCSASTGPAPSQTTGKASVEASAPIKSGFGTGANTAQGNYDAAEKSMKAVAPDAVFISVQTGAAVTDPPAIWTYLFASKKTKKGYAVTVAKGTASKPLKLSTESLRADEWAKVPASTADWKVDSDVALKRATAAFTKQLEMAPPKMFVMGMTVFVADTKAKGTAIVKPFTWVIAYQADAELGIPAVRQIEVDAKTGTVAPLPE